ncbi:hypothetical protein [Planotetraspora sp. GP83]|uniref:hypothetical protein n=1 Tax=Planotetraspora sp. GP83 TaxID=3156264 RepID=UPI003515896F
MAVGPAGGSRVTVAVGSGAPGTTSSRGGGISTLGSAMAAQGWAMIAPVVADTAASRRPETRVARREEMRGVMDGSSSI